MAAKSVTVKQVRSSIGSRKDQISTLRALGLGKPGSTRELEDTHAIRGMIRKVSHLVVIEAG